jgi:sugar phosphate isomerase/epimerase
MQITWSIFPKFQKELDPHGLAGFVQEVGLDTTNLVVRDGYWVTPGNLAADTEKFVKAMRREGIEIRFATTSYTPDQLIKDPTPLKVFADNGIRGFRMGYFDVKPDVRGEIRRARSDLQRLVPLCQQHKVRAIYQLHHGTLFPSPSAAYLAFEGLPTEAIAIELDPGNQSFEGFENYERSTRLLGESVAWAAAKDSVVTRDEKRADLPDKGWRRTWAPAYEGTVRWDEFFDALAAIDFHGVVKLMPFYDQNNPAEQRKKLKREVEYLKQEAERAERDRVKKA